MTQARRRAIGTLMVAAVVTGCGTGSGTAYPAPVDPRVTITRFMEAVAADDLPGLGRLWGTSSGPMTGRMNPRELDQRLTVMQRYLQHEAYEILEGSVLINTKSRRNYRVQIRRAGCVHVVPFEVIRSGGGWLVHFVDLAEAGNPGRQCRADGQS